MTHYEPQPLIDALLPACRSAFGDLWKNHRSERFYCMALYTSGDLGYLVPTAMTEEGLDRVFQEYRANPKFDDMADDRLRLTLRWSPTDSPYHLEGQEHFGEVDAIMADVSERFHDIDDDDQWEQFVDEVDNAIVTALNQLDREGVFGTGRERDAVFVTFMMGDQDDTILDYGRVLNPPSTYRRFKAEWEKLTK